jgi:hypothetical protein
MIYGMIKKHTVDFNDFFNQILLASSGSKEQKDAMGPQARLISGISFLIVGNLIPADDTTGRQCHVWVAARAKRSTACPTLHP